MTQTKAWAWALGLACAAGVTAAALNWTTTPPPPSRTPYQPPSQTLAARRPASTAPTRPITFEPGGTEPGSPFIARGAGYFATLRATDATVFVGAGAADGSRAATATPVRLQFVGARPDAPGRGESPRASFSNYVRGAERSDWRLRVPHFDRVSYREVYPQIDLEFYSRHQELEYDLVVAPGGDPASIRLSFGGPGAATLDPSGDLIVKAGERTLRQRRPVAYQQGRDRRQPVDAQYTLLADGSIGIEVGAFDRARPLVIDPVLEYATLFGGSAQDLATDLAADPAGNVYVTGYTFSADLPFNGGGDPSFNGSEDIFVAKFSAIGTLIWSTYYGGTGDEYTDGLTLGNGAVYVAGATNGTVPLPLPRFDGVRNGNWDPLVARFDPSSGALTAATLLGGTDANPALGTEADNAWKVEVNASGAVVVVGKTVATDFPTSLNGFDRSHNGGIDAYVVALSASLDTLQYGTFLGGSLDDRAIALALRPGTNAAYVTGQTQSANFPVTPGAFDTTPNGDFDVFVTQIPLGGGGLTYSTYLGGTNFEYGTGIAVDALGRATVTGYTASTGFPRTNEVGFSGFVDGFAARLTPAGDALVFSTYFGGSDSDYAWDVAIDGAGAAYITGRTLSPNFTSTGGAFSRRPFGGSDAYLLKLADSGEVNYASYIGTGGFDQGLEIALGPAGALSLVGYTATTAGSTAFPVTGNGFDGTGNGGDDAFLMRFAPAFDSHVRGYDQNAYAIPPAGSVDSTIDIGGVSGEIESVTVSAHVTHTWNGDLTLTLIAPDETAVTLTSGIGISSDNYGAACGPESQRTTFDDAAGSDISAGTAPFVGSFRPVQPLSVFQGQHLSNLSGTWRLRATDIVAADTGTIRCWTLNIKLRSPVVTGISPSTGPFTGGPTVTVTGQHFTFCDGDDCVPPDLRIGGVPLSVLTWSETSVTGTLPARFAGPADVTVTDYWRRSGTLSDGFTYLGPQLTVIRAGSGTGTVSSTPGGISCGADCTESYPAGTSVTLAASANPGSAFAGWSGEGCSGTGTCTVSMTQARSVTAMFNLEPQLLTVTRSGLGIGSVSSNPAGISCGADCTESYPANTSVTLTAVANTGSSFAGWSGEACSGIGTCTVTMSQARNVTATFDTVPLILTVTRSGAGSGAISSNPLGISCGADCSESYPLHTTVTLTASAATGSTFVGWTGEGCSGTGTCSVTMSQARAVTATFDAVAPTVDTKAGWRRPSFAASRYTAFESALPMVPADTNGVSDIYVHDDVTDTLRRVSIATTGHQAIGGESVRAAIDPTGRFVAFESLATNLVPSDTNGLPDVFLHDRDSDDDGVFDETGGTSTSRVSISSNGDQALGGGSGTASLDGTGRFVAFQSAATNLAANDTNPGPDVFVHDRLLGRTVRVSVATDNSSPPPGASQRPVISQNGRFVAFDSAAALVAPDSNGVLDIYVHDRDLDRDGVFDEAGATATRRVSVATSGAPTTSGNSVDASITGDGRYVVFASDATTLVASDTNGVTDIFIHDRDVDADGFFDEIGQIATRRLSVGPGGAQLTIATGVPRISANGKMFVFLAAAPLSSPVVGAAGSRLIVDAVASDPGKSTGGWGENPTDPDEDGGVIIEPGPPEEDIEDPAVGPDGSQRGGTDVGDTPKVVIIEQPEDEPTPFIGGLTPAHGATGGGTLVRISGRDLDGTLYWNGSPLATASRTATEWTAVAPARGAGPVAVPIHIQAGDRTSNTWTFTYAALSTPRWSDHQPRSAPVTGGGTLTITGSGFVNPSVRLGPYPATVTASTPTSISVAVPQALVTGAVPVVIVNADGAESTSGDPFTYENGAGTAAIDVVQPTTMSIGGGDSITILGSGFQPGTTVTFNLRPAANVQVLSSRALLVETPSGSPGDAVLAVTVPGQPTVSRTVTYMAPPVISLGCTGADVDGDGMDDVWERQFGLAAGDASDGVSDPDYDGRTSAEECAAGTHPRGLYTRYLAEGATGTFFQSRVVIANPGSTPARVILRFQTSAGLTPSKYVLIPAMSRYTVPAAEVDGLSAAEFSTVVESDVDVVVDRTMLWQALGTGIYGSHAESSVVSPRTEWYLAEGATGQFQLYYLLQNPTPSAAVVRVRYLRPSGLPPIERDYTVQGLRRLTIGVNLVPGLGTTDVSAAFRSLNGVPIIVERAMYRSATSRTFESGHNSAAIGALATRWFFAEGATGGIFDTFLLLVNPNETTADVAISYLLKTGATINRTYQVSPNSRATIVVANQAPELANAEVSSVVTVTNGVAIAAERAMWWPSLAATTAGFPFPLVWGEAHNSPGSTVTGTKWAVADGETGPAPANTKTFILVANTSSYTADFSVTLLGEHGQAPIVRHFTTPANSRFTVDVRALFPETEQEGNRTYGAIVESHPVNGQPPAEIVVERAMYSDAVGIVWAAGSNLLATRLR